MSHQEQSDTVHQAFTWVGLFGFAVGVLLIPVANYAFEQSIEPMVAIAVIVASTIAVGSQRAANIGAKLIKAWRSGE